MTSLHLQTQESVSDTSTPLPLNLEGIWRFLFFQLSLIMNLWIFYKKFLMSIMKNLYISHTQDSLLSTTLTRCLVVVTLLLVVQCTVAPVVAISSLLLFVAIVVSVQHVETCIPLTELLLWVLNPLTALIVIVFLQSLKSYALIFLKTILFSIVFSLLSEV